MNSIQSPTAPTTADNAPQYLSLQQVAAELHCSVRTVRRLIANGRLGYSQEKPYGVIRVSRDDIAAYYAATRKGPAAPIQRGRARAAA